MRKITLGRRMATVAATTAALLAPAAALARGAALRPGNLLVTGSTYREADIQPGVTQLPPHCTTPNCVTATADGAYPYVFNNALVDGSFGVTSPIFLEQVATSGVPLSEINVPSRQLVTSFSSKSEEAINQSTNDNKVTFMDYVAPVAALDASNSNTPGVIDPTNPVPGAYYRAVATLGRWGQFSFTETNAYSGNNGRAAILNDTGGADLLYTAGNAGNGASPQPPGVILGAGAQIMHRAFLPETLQSPGLPIPVGSFDITQLGLPQDKIGKDDNFRGLTIYHNVLYYTKGSGGNGVNTVYFVDTTGTACPAGSGVPARGASLPTSPLAYNPATLQATGLPSNMCVLRGFPTLAAKSTTGVSHPFGLWFANPQTVYVADEGDGDNTYDPVSGTYTAAGAQTTAGLQKWVLDSSTRTWHLAYTLSSGLGLGQPYTVPGYPTGDNSATGLPWAPATDGLRNITGKLGGDGTATIWAVTSTVSGNGDQGADPNQLVKVTDPVAATSPGSERFVPVRSAGYGDVLRGVSFTPGTPTQH